MNGDCIIQLAEPQIDKYERQALATHNAVAWQDRLTDNWLILEEVNPLPKASSVSSLPDWHRQWLSARHSSRCCFWSLCCQTASCLCARKAFVSLRSLVCLQSRLHAPVRSVIHIHKQIDFFLLYFERGNWIDVCTAPDATLSFHFVLGNKVWFMARGRSSFLRESHESRLSSNVAALFFPAGVRASWRWHVLNWTSLSLTRWTWRNMRWAKCFLLRFDCCLKLNCE